MSTDDAARALAAKAVAETQGYRIVDDEWRTGAHKPVWWEQARSSTVFVLDADVPKIATLRELARREQMTLHSHKRVIDSQSGVIFWLTAIETHTDAKKVAKK